ncbi:MAG: NAD(P)H-dependent oxidoreductase [Acidimicrobiales bacterium]|nr:NAD(P)H-dependent oxidoreductase [Acidimicrobiales bacterium]
MDLRACLLNCTLKPSPAASSTDAMLGLFREGLTSQGVTVGDTLRIVDHRVAPGVSHDEGGGDEWPSIEEQILAAQILVFGTPIWVGHPASTAQRVVERLDAFISETDDRGQMPTADRVALVAVVGNEDGAHHVGAELYQALADVGFTIPANGQAYWVGPAMGSTDFQDLDEVPDKVRSTASTAVANGVHLARLLAGEPYPAVG